jgi:hypothetical protein
MFVTGFAAAVFAYTLVYMSAAFSLVLNKGHEDTSTRRLQTLGMYGENNKAVWIHRDTGDAFGYDPASRRWGSVGNIGVRLIDTTPADR